MKFPEFLRPGRCFESVSGDVEASVAIRLDTGDSLPILLFDKREDLASFRVVPPGQANLSLQSKEPDRLVRVRAFLNKVLERTISAFVIPVEVREEHDRPGYG